MRGGTRAACQGFGWKLPCSHAFGSVVESIGPAAVSVVYTKSAWADIEVKGQIIFTCNYSLNDNCIFSFVDYLDTVSRSVIPIFNSAQRIKTRQVSRDRILFLNLQNTLNPRPRPPASLLLAPSIDLNAILQ
jgi:hypothetical protein